MFWMKILKMLTLLIDPQEEQESMPTETQSISVPPLDLLRGFRICTSFVIYQQKKFILTPRNQLFFLKLKADEYIPPPPPASLPLPPPPVLLGLQKAQERSPFRRSGRDRISSSHN